VTGRPVSRIPRTSHRIERAERYRSGSRAAAGVTSTIIGLGVALGVGLGLGLGIAAGLGLLSGTESGSQLDAADEEVGAPGRSADPPGYADPRTSVPAPEPAVPRRDGMRSGPQRADRPASMALRPVAALLHPGNLDDGRPEELEVHFGSTFVEVLDPTGFTVTGGPTGREVASTEARILAGSSDGVLVAFPAGTDLARSPAVTVALGTVEDNVGRTNVADTVPLTGSVVGGEADGPAPRGGPELLGVEREITLDRVTFAFDRPLEDRAAAVDFTVVGIDGHVAHGQDVVDVTDRRVLVDFAFPVEHAVRFAVAHGAVRDRFGVSGPVGAVGGATAAPDLQHAVQGPGNVQVDVVFDQPVQDAIATRFVLYDHRGVPHRGATVVRPAPEVVRVAFPDVTGMTPGSTSVATRGGAVRSLGGMVRSSPGATRVTDGGPAATAGGADPEAVIVGERKPGPTAGPDPVAWQRDVVTGQLVVEFDERLDHQVRPSPEAFRLVTPAGDVVVADAVVEVTDETVILNANPAIVGAASGLTVASGAVQDRFGGRSAMGTLDAEAHHEQ
jgi:hypothetical protein